MFSDFTCVIQNEETKLWKPSLLFKPETIISIVSKASKNNPASSKH